MTAGPRERLIESAITLIREHGVHGTGLTELLTHSKTARGSIYQHFPGGKTELIEHATLSAGEQMSALIEARADSPSALIATLVRWWKRTLEASDYRFGCPVVAAALAEQTAAATVFEEWERRLTAALTAAGMDEAAAPSMATFIVSAIEGAIIQSRSTKSPRPLDAADAHLRKLLEVYLGS
ncbi:TetR/AcrR family transcriptional regulator [Amycolatopsis sp. NPDC059657]|uniref:TetR/AcrR family transcriptional regulator n=1 Tax=Amycolatopsis sp. NPDC059657 TaxID=3346899 RepID=UPI00366FDB8B